jgi:ATP-dependent DNA helicase DinG
MNDAKDPALEQDVARAFADGGTLSRLVKGFRARPSQAAFAQAVRQAIETCVPLIAEAGTGTGKTFGYLVPAMLAGGKIVVSTATKTLQDQLFAKDVPAVRDALRVPVTIALLKGRSNYVCHFHLDRHLKEGTFTDRHIPVHLKRIAKWSKVTATGDRGHLDDVPETSGAWAYATSTRDNCLGQDCPKYSDCFVMKARRAANNADLVVVNHHLFFADLMLREEGVSELLPSANTVIFDEAHHLPDTATAFFGASVSSSQMIELARDIKYAQAAHAKDYRPLADVALTLDRAASDLRLVFSIMPKGKPPEGQPRGRARDRIPAKELGTYVELPEAIASVDAALNDVMRELDSQAEREPEFGVLSARAAALQATLRGFDEARSRTDVAQVRWAELYAASVAFNTAPLNVGPKVKEQLARERRAWIFTSATLSVRGDFSHFQRQLGLDEATTATWESPFDYANNALLYVPESMPEANAPEFIDAVVDTALPVIIAAGGRAFVLCTSLKAMHRAGELLKALLAAAGHTFPVFVQGEAGKLELLSRFRKAGNAVLVASQSFWEGVDVRGDTLSLVVIDKLPFAVPDDPLLSARMENINAEGGSAFFDLQLPQAVITLKQGVGRLIRDDHDRGVLMICDTRIVDKGYGKRIWRSLPPFRRTRDSAVAIDFFASGRPVVVKDEGVSGGRPGGADPAHGG